jgi:hypothetical protein
VLSETLLCYSLRPAKWALMSFSDSESRGAEVSTDQVCRPARARSGTSSSAAVVRVLAEPFYDCR